MEPFSIVEEQSEHRLLDRFEELNAKPRANPTVEYLIRLRQLFPEYIVTAVGGDPDDIRDFAAAGHAVLEADTSADPELRFRYWTSGSTRHPVGRMDDIVLFARYRLVWNSEEFVLFVVYDTSFILKEPRDSETVHSVSKLTDQLMEAVGTWRYPVVNHMYVVDEGMIFGDRHLYNQIKHMSWDQVILDGQMKKDLQDVANKFFDSEQLYKNLGVPWKRGIIFHGPAGNGKTLCIKALMHTIYSRPEHVYCIYVKSMEYTWQIARTFEFARSCSPCMLVLEDVETIVTDETRSYFLNEIDGLENNNGILIVATTNFLNKLDPGLTKRPSRFDRKYFFPLPNKHERSLYAEFWREKVNKSQRGNKDKDYSSDDGHDGEDVGVEFPKLLCAEMARITDGFSFAYMQEAFVASLLTIARSHADNPKDKSRKHDKDDDLDRYELWRAFKDQVKALRKDMDTDGSNDATVQQTVLSYRSKDT